MDKALCAYIPDPDQFFPGPGQSSRTSKAKMICFQCPVMEQCRDYRDETGSTDGIWGGESNKRKKKKS